MIRRLFGLIPRILQILMEFGGMRLIFAMLKLYYGTGDAFISNLFDDLFSAIFVIYFISIITIIIGWIFNIFTKMEDYSDGGRFYTLLLAPIMLPYHTLLHIYSTIGYLFTGKTCTEGDYSSFPGGSSGGRSSGGSSSGGSSSGGGTVSSEKLKSLLKNAAYRAARILRVDSTTSARLHAFDCYTLNYVVHVSVTLAISDSYGSVSDYSISTLCTEAQNDIESALNSVLSAYYEGDVTWEYSISINYTIR